LDSLSATGWPNVIAAPEPLANRCPRYSPALAFELVDAARRCCLDGERFLVIAMSTVTTTRFA
jgi:hypothetical protein